MPSFTIPGSGTSEPSWKSTPQHLVPRLGVWMMAGTIPNTGMSCTFSHWSFPHRAFLSSKREERRHETHSVGTQKELLCLCANMLAVSWLKEISTESQHGSPEAAGKRGAVAKTQLPGRAASKVFPSPTPPPLHYLSTAQQSLTNQVGDKYSVYKWVCTGKETEVPNEQTNTK